MCLMLQFFCYFFKVAIRLYTILKGYCSLTQIDSQQKNNKIELTDSQIF